MRPFRVPNAEYAGKKPHMGGTEAKRYRRDSARYWMQRPEPRPSLLLEGAVPCLCHGDRSRR